MVGINCPKCGSPIKMFDIKPNCSKCGVNILYYTQEKELERDAKRTELEFASARILGAKLKAQFIDGGLQIARLVVVLLCVAALVVPFAGVSVKLPAADIGISVGGIGAYKLFSDGLLMLLPSMTGSTLLADAAVFTLVLYALFLVLALVTILNVATELLGFLNIKKAAKVMTVVSAVAIALSIVTAAAMFVVKSRAGGITGVSTGFGAFVAAGVNAAYMIINRKIYKMDIALKVHENDFERKALLKKVRAGEVSLDDLTLPVFETEEERKARFEALAKALKDEEEGREV